MTEDNVNAYQPIIDAINTADHDLEHICELLKIWPIELFNESGKWKYTAHGMMDKPEVWVDFDVLINAALEKTPSSLRGVTFTSIPKGWRAVMVNNPLGYPIMVTG